MLKHREMYMSNTSISDHLPVPTGDNIELIVLKGHILIEQQLHEFLFERMYTYKPIEDSRPSFKVLLSFSEALCQYENFEWLWKVISKLNVLRNHLAHKLDDQSFDDKLTNFIAEFEHYQPNVITDEVRGLGSEGGEDNSIGCMIAFLIGVFYDIIPCDEK